MKRFSEQLKKKADTLRLSAAEKHDLRSRVVSYMEYHPLPGGSRAIAAPSRFAFLYNVQLFRTAGALAMVLLVSVPFVAERAVPGDVLYPVKVRLNEQVQSTLVRSPYEKVVWETERLERRLAEARLLASEGKLTPEAEAEVAEAVKEHSEAAQKGIASIRETDSDEAAMAEIALSSALDVQSEMLQGHSVALFGVVDAARQVAIASQQTSRPSYDRLLAGIESESTRASELFNTVSGEMNEREREDIERTMREIRRGVTAATGGAESDAETAVTKLTVELKKLRKLSSFMTDIDVRTSVTLAELFPDERSDDERVADLETLTASTTERVEDVRARVVYVDVNTRTAVTDRLAEAEEYMSAAAAADDITSAEAALGAAAVIVDELEGLLDAYEVETGVSTRPSTTTPATSTTQGE
ncbi:MAG: DUF5667 domain-containing protein [Candidatus Paceibacterota bacterium]